MDTKKMVTLGLFIAIAGVLQVVESWLALPMPVPGVKLGLANIVSLVVISTYGWRDAVLVASVRVALGSLLGGAFLGPAFLMSMSGALVSTLVMAGVYHHCQNQFSFVGTSLFGAAAHNLTQITVAATIVSNSGLFWYLPYLLLSAVPVGIATGVTTSFFCEKMVLFQK